MLEHGGRLVAAAQRYGIAREDWLDLSTGINPEMYPLPTVPQQYWQRLPELDDGLEAAAACYYGGDGWIAVPGSQWAIQQLPQLMPGQRIAFMTPSYAEHRHAFRHLSQYFCQDAAEIDALIDEIDILFLTHPNNPTGMRFPHQKLHQWHDCLQRKGGFLVVDEAFLDVTPDLSLANQLIHSSALVILRSLGKFFGLAGLRVGFIAVPSAWQAQIREGLGPWPVSGPSRYIACQALQDRYWQQWMRQRLQYAGQRLQTLLSSQPSFQSVRGAVLFQYVETSLAKTFYQQLARQGILVRYFAQPAALRFGLPGSDEEWKRLEKALLQLRY